jgi:hypothetical protein
MIFRVPKKANNFLAIRFTVRSVRRNVHCAVTKQLVCTLSLSLSGNFWLKCGPCFPWIPVSRTKCCWPSLRGYESGPSLCEVFRLERSETPGTESGCFSIAVGQLSPLGYSNVRRMAMTVPAWRTVAVRVTKYAVKICVSSLLWKKTAPFFKKKYVLLGVALQLGVSQVVRYDVEQWRILAAGASDNNDRAWQDYGL